MMRQARCRCYVFSSTQAAADVRCPSLLPSRSRGRYVFSQKTSKPPKPLLEGGWTLFWGGKKQAGGHLHSLPPLRSDCFTQTVVSPQKCPALARHHHPGSSTGLMPTGSARTRQVVLHPAPSPSAAPSCPPALVQHAPNETAADVPLISVYSRLEPKANGIFASSRSEAAWWQSQDLHLWVSRLHRRAEGSSVLPKSSWGFPRGFPTSSWEQPCSDPTKSPLKEALLSAREHRFGLVGLFFFLCILEVLTKWSNN